MVHRALPLYRPPRLCWTTFMHLESTRGIQDVCAESTKPTPTLPVLSVWTIEAKGRAWLLGIESHFEVLRL